MMPKLALLALSCSALLPYADATAMVYDSVEITANTMQQCGSTVEIKLSPSVALTASGDTIEIATALGYPLNEDALVVGVDIIVKAHATAPVAINTYSAAWADVSGVETLTITTTAGITSTTTSKIEILLMNFCLEATGATAITAATETAKATGNSVIGATVFATPPVAGASTYSLDQDTHVLTATFTTGAATLSGDYLTIWGYGMTFDADSECSLTLTSASTANTAIATTIVAPDATTNGNTGSAQFVLATNEAIATATGASVVCSKVEVTATATAAAGYNAIVVSAAAASGVFKQATFLANAAIATPNPTLSPTSNVWSGASSAQLGFAAATASLLAMLW